MAATVIVVGGVGSQPALGAGLTAVPGFVEPLDSHRIRLKELLNDVSVSVVEIAAEVSPCESSEIPHTVDSSINSSLIRGLPLSGIEFTSHTGGGWLDAVFEFILHMGSVAL